MQNHLSGSNELVVIILVDRHKHRCLSNVNWDPITSGAWLHIQGLAAQPQVVFLAGRCAESERRSLWFVGERGMVRTWRRIGVTSCFEEVRLALVFTDDARGQVLVVD